MKINLKKMALTTVAIATTFSLFSTTASYGAVKLTTVQKKQLQYLVEEEKLARDVYNYFAANVTTQKFANIAKSEQTHMTYVANILKTYGVTNPAATTKPGVFKDATLQKLYNDLIANGKSNALAAFAAGVKIEETDIADLKADNALKMPADVQGMLDALLKGSENHLAAFSR